MENFARELLRKFAIEVPVLDSDEREVLERFRACTGPQKEMILAMLREVIPASGD